MTGAGRQVTVVRPERGQTVRVAGDVYRFLGAGAGTDGSYVLWETEVPPGGGPPPHMHAREEEGFYVLEGEIDFTAEGTTLRAGPGAYLNMPKTTPHSFRNNTDRPARMLVLCAPAGIEHFFMEADGKPPEALAEIAARYGITILSARLTMDRPAELWRAAEFRQLRCRPVPDLVSARCGSGRRSCPS